MQSHNVNAPPTARDISQAVHQFLHDFPATTQNLFLQAASRGDLGQVINLYQAGVDVQARDSEGRNALHVAVLNHRPEMVELLLHFGVDHMAHDERGKTPLDLINSMLALPLATAEFARNKAAVTRLPRVALTSASTQDKPPFPAARMDVNIDLPDHEGRSALWKAAAAGKLDIVLLLHKLGADIGRPDRFGITPIRVAAKNQHRAVVEALIQRGAQLEPCTMAIFGITVAHAVGKPSDKPVDATPPAPLAQATPFPRPGPHPSSAFASRCDALCRPDVSLAT